MCSVFTFVQYICKIEIFKSMEGENVKEDSCIPHTHVCMCVWCVCNVPVFERERLRERVGERENGRFRTVLLRTDNKSILHPFAILTNKVCNKETNE